ncbi:MAG TPA: hypothetical protein VFL99_17230 [Segeticoccus sp.]|uniref:hypothetical protein n=1 Tax=Segeticoccus sp. TaxID=2706531 RepID=UPI002D804784|nr:hypothetical protein [Segeticoccus sp.]HET8602072.1 hypothetical protein [Segeticoccus sp.]
MARHPRWATAPSRPVHVLWWVALAAPIVCAFALQWLPALNGPHLWLGLPAILWWTTIPGSALVTVVLLLIEQTRTDDAEQDRLDEEAAREAAAREAAQRTAEESRA